MKFNNDLGNISIATDMFNYSIKPEFEKKLQLFAEYGIKYVHWGDDWNKEIFYSKHTIELYRQLIELHGIKCIDVHGVSTPIINIDAVNNQIFTKYIQLLQNRIEFCSAVGGDVVVVHPPNIGSDRKEASRKIERSIRAFEGVRPLCEDLGIALAVENCKLLDIQCLEYYLSKYPPEFVGFCFDSGHANINNNLDQLFRFRNRLRALHLNDNRGKDDDHQPPFFGTINWEHVMHWIVSSGYSKPINFEIVHNSKFFEDAINKFMEHTIESIQKVISLISCNDDSMESAS